MTSEQARVRAQYTVLAEFDYEPRPVKRGYTDRTLYVNLTDNVIASKPRRRKVPAVVKLDDGATGQQHENLLRRRLAERRADAQALLDVRHVGGTQIEADQGTTINQRRTGDLDVVDARGTHDLVVNREDGPAGNVKPPWCPMCPA